MKLLLLSLCLSLHHPLPDRVALAIDSAIATDSTQAASAMLVPFQREIEHVASASGLPAALLAAFVQEESRFSIWATRAEPGYFSSSAIKRESARFSAAHSGQPTAFTERVLRSTSFGLMQVMGETARAQGFGSQPDERYLAALYLPENSLREGATLLKRLLARYPHDTLAAISAYNQGSARRRHGTYLNARYVYRVCVAWRSYSEAFAHKSEETTR